jgi:hypothetical protein
VSGIVRAEEICPLPLSNTKHRFFGYLDFFAYTFFSRMLCTASWKNVHKNRWP